MAALTLNDLTRDELLCLVRSLNVTLDAVTLAQTRVDQAHQVLEQARDAYHAALATATADAKAATAHAECHGFDDLWHKRFAQSKASSAVASKLGGDYVQATRAYNAASARLRAAERGAA